MKWMKGYLAGLLTALLLCGLVVTAGAKSGKVMQELTYRDIRVSLDGEVLDLRNAVGDKVEPFMFDGTNYLPVRALAEALGLNVAWDGKEVMVVLTTPTPPAPEPEATVEPTPAKEPEPIVEPTPAKEPEPTPSPAPVTTDKRSGNLGKYHVEIKGARLAQSYDGKDAIGITYIWTNNSDETQSSAVALMEKAFQNGVQLKTTILDDDHDEFMTDIRPGASLETESAFLIESATAPVEVEITEFLGDDTEFVKATFNPAELTKAISEKASLPTKSMTVDNVVYVTPTGKHYHYSDSCNGGTYVSSTLSAALARGLTACDKCVLTGN